jgi:hypothetical protein
MQIKDRMRGVADPGCMSTQDHLIVALDRAEMGTYPFRHWLFRQILPSITAEALTLFPFRGDPIGDTAGRRETHNAMRRFCTPESGEAFPPCADLAAVFQAPKTIRAIEALCGVDLTGSLLRIELCRDTDGFWLEPHTDIGAKLFTLLIYLSQGPGAADLGTDLYADPAQPPIGRAPAPFGSGLAFVPAGDTWHGFVRRPIARARRSVIVNYVVPGWRSRHELAYPEQPVGR